MSNQIEAYMSANLFEMGMGYVLVARFKSNGDVEAGSFLIDAHCLGVKDGFFTRVSAGEFRGRILDRMVPEDNRLELDPAEARHLVESAVAYAQNLGFAPHPDYKKACRVLGGITPVAPSKPWTFGDDGKPHYVQGPHDSHEKAMRIMTQLRIRCGEGNYRYTILHDENDRN
jgi:hypothetical protein